MTQASIYSSSGPARRIENIQKLIGELARREMKADEIATFLRYSPSGAGKYIRDLREARVIELARYLDGTITYIGKAIYALSSDSERIQTFLAALVQPKHRTIDHSAKRLPKLPEISMCSGRQFHILADDTNYAIRVNSAPAQRDPLVAAFFGSAQAQKA
jgi:hypothetical protein